MGRGEEEGGGSTYDAYTLITSKRKQRIEVNLAESLIIIKD